MATTTHIDLVPPERLGRVLRSARTDANRSPEELSFASNGRFSPDALREFEAGERRLTVATIDDLVRCYGVARAAGAQARRASGGTRAADRKPAHRRLEVDAFPDMAMAPSPSDPLELLCRFIAATAPSNTSGSPASAPLSRAIMREVDLAVLSTELRIERGELERMMLAAIHGDPERLRSHEKELAGFSGLDSLPVLVGYTPSSVLVLQPERLDACEAPSDR